jgi:VIT1/CCC1 family predicted Fe2+/Mn2+ transporter
MSATPPPRRGNHRLSRAQEFLKPIVYGGNDGIVTTFAIVAGFAGARAEGAAELGVVAVLVFGLANLFADAVSMGLGEFLSGRSQRDLYQAQRTRELARLRGAPADGSAEVARILEDRGLPPDSAAHVAQHLAQSPDIMTDLTMTYTYDMADPRSARPAADGLITFSSFVALGGIPLIPYFILPATGLTFGLSVAATLIALVFLGLVRWSATREWLLRCVAETVLVGSTCAVVAYAVGALVAAF